MLGLGEAPGEIELLAEPLEWMIRAAEGLRERCLGSRQAMPHFTRGLLLARRAAHLARHRRAEMPVIDEEDIPALRALLGELRIEEMCDTCVVPARELRPSQCQIYVDRSIRGTAHIGTDATRRLLLSQHMVVDVDSTIVDGHHRWLSAMLLGQDTQCLVYRFRARAEDVLAQLLGFSDARHMRNG